MLSPGRWNREKKKGRIMLVFRLSRRTQTKGRNGPSDYIERTGGRSAQDFGHFLFRASMWSFLAVDGRLSGHSGGDSAHPPSWHYL